ncbi:MAG: response regulator [Candidatus Thermoplasmatota archaeon]|nr:response regulator [Candidatus Thermoplasmatota archaeon]MBS3790822.1 response regulator [Candidatus Thermoplasmatota archaeon]
MPKSVLIVDDTNFMRKMLRDLLSEHYDVVGEAENGKECLEKVKEDNPDLITLDVIMPEMDGLEALSKLKERDEDQKVIMVTSVGQHEKITEAMKKGAEGYIIKPFDEEKVLEEIEKALGS